MFKKFFAKGGSEGKGGANHRAELGRSGEALAERYLKKKGYRILERNFRGRYGEIDIIAGKADGLIFIEVKTRSGSKYGAPKEAVDARKASRIIKASQEYMQSKGTPEDTAIRFDVIGISTEKEEPEIEHIEAAFDT